MIFQKGIKVTVEGPSAESIKITTSNSKGSFKITVSGVTSPKALKSIVIPVWSDANQKDIVWYTATKQSDGTYTVSSDISKHGYRMGTYHAHVYAKETSGKMTYMLNDNFTIQGSVDSLTAELSEDGTTAKIKASGISLPMEVSKIEFAVWSKENGQDDIKWYSAALKDGEASVSVPISNHKTAGDYNVHMYAKTASGRVYVTNTTFNIAVSAKADVEFSDREESKGTFKVTATLSDVEGTVSGVKAKVWCKGESTDLNTYTAKENSDGSYSFTVDIANHKVNTGTYKVEIYPVFAGEVEVLAGSGQYSFSVSDCITIVNKGSGKRQAVLKNPSAKYSKVKFPTWSDTNGQDDIVWYNATKQSDGSWTADIVTGKHSGKYIVHCYCDDVYKGNTNFTFDESEMKSIGAQKVDEYASRIIAATGGNLRSIYLWIVNNINYEHMAIPMAYPAGYTRQQYYMVYGFEHRTGNCFVYAALFYWTALKLGYNAKLIEGRYRRNDGTHGEHGWVEIWQNGVAYVCDPEIAWQGMQYDTYMRPYGSTVLTYFPNERAY